MRTYLSTARYKYITLKRSSHSEGAGVLFLGKIYTISCLR